MMDFLFTAFMVPLFPALGEPQVNHAVAVAEIEQRLSAGENSVPLSAGIANAGSVGVSQAELPVITGRLFEWSKTQMANEVDRGSFNNLSAATLRLTGLIESAGQRVAILNDGRVDYVVGVGSYVLDAYKVTSLGPGRVVLSRIDSHLKSNRIELNLMPMDAPGGVQ